MAAMNKEASPSRVATTTFEISPRAKRACAELRQAAIAQNHPMPPEPLCEELLDTVTRAAAQSAESMKNLRAAVARFTLALKDDGVSPEAILVALKSIINSQAFPMVVSPSREGSTDHLRELISTWCIEDMFRERQS